MNVLFYFGIIACDACKFTIARATSLDSRLLKTEQPVEKWTVLRKKRLSFLNLTQPSNNLIHELTVVDNGSRINILINILKSIGQPVWNWKKQSRCFCQILKLILRSNHQQIYKNSFRSNPTKKILSGQKGRKIYRSSDNGHRRSSSLSHCQLLIGW